MRKLILAILVAGLVACSGAMATGGNNNHPPVYVPCDPTSTLTICGVSLGSAVAGFGDDGVATFTSNTVSGIKPIKEDGITGTPDGFVVNSKVDPVVVGEFVGSSLSVAADQTVDKDGSLKLVNVEGISSATNDVKIDVAGADSACANINSFTDTNVKVDQWPCGTNCANSISTLHVDAKATGGLPS